MKKHKKNSGKKEKTFKERVAEARPESQRLLQIVLSANTKLDVVRPLHLASEPAADSKVPGLKEYEIEGTPLRLLGMEDHEATPTLEQRVAMAKRLNEVGPKLPRYAQIQHNTITIGERTMKGKLVLPAGVDPKEIEKAHRADMKEVAKREKENAVEAKKKT